MLFSGSAHSKSFYPDAIWLNVMDQENLELKHQLVGVSHVRKNYSQEQHALCEIKLRNLEGI